MSLLRTIRTAALALAACAALALAAAPAHAQTVADIVKRGKVRIGVLIGAPPYGSIDAQGKPVGYDADVANLVAKYMGVPIEMVPLTPPSRIPDERIPQIGDLVRRKADAITAKLGGVLPGRRDDGEG